MPIKRSNYPPDWPAITARILERAQYMCDNCGVPRYAVGYRSGENKAMNTLIVGKDYREANELRHRIQLAMKRKIIVIRLTTAHLNHDEWNHNVVDTDLACFCEKCHLDHDRIDNQKRKQNGKQYKRFQLEIFK